MNFKLTIAAMSLCGTVAALTYDSGGIATDNASITPNSVTTTGTGATIVIDNGLVSQTLTDSLPAQSSGWMTSTSKDFTLSQSTNGTNGNVFFTNTTGDYGWSFHANMASGSTGSMGYVFGLHQDETFGLFGTADVATPHPVKLYHRNSTMSTPMIEVEAETDWYTDYTSGLTPTYSGSLTGPVFDYRKRNVLMARIDTDGSFYSYADSGNDYVRLYTIANTAGVMRANVPVARWDEVTGSYIDFSPTLTGNLLTAVADTGDVSVTASGGDYTLASSLHTVYVATQTVAGGNTITADACGSIKNVSSAGAVTTNTTNTFTALSQNLVCIMHLVNVGSNNITLDNNANFVSPGGADVVVTPNDAIMVGTTNGTVWYALSALVAN